MPNYDPDSGILEGINRHLVPLALAGWDYHPVISAAKGKSFVLIGEATHGTKEFYRIRAEITQRLIAEQGFDGVAVEADWPDAWRANRYACGRGDDANAEAALSDFQRFPTWMWRNGEVSTFLEWLHDYNEDSGRVKTPAGFYGLDLYSMRASIAAVIDYLDRIDPPAAAAARERYACFGNFVQDPDAYGWAAVSGVLESCEQQVLSQLRALQEKRFAYHSELDEFGDDEFFSAEQNAEVVRKSEEYYRAMYYGRPNSWNLRDRHMFSTAENLAQHLEKKLGRVPRLVIWAHNSHLGDASATAMAQRGEINIGSLMREKYGDNMLNIGFSTSRGTVTAAPDWDGDAETKDMRPPLPGSYEHLFSRAAERQFILDLRGKNSMRDALMQERLQRAIGVIYRPDTERQSHYFHAQLPRQFDFIVHIEETEALEPLAAAMDKRPGEMDETYPTGL